MRNESNRVGAAGVILATGIVWLACRAAPGAGVASANPETTAPISQAMKRVREPAVAGLFYPPDAAALNAALDQLLDSGASETLPGLRALICPHAGYRYSGPIAASAYRLLRGQTHGTVYLLAPSHYALFRGASVCGADVYRTPLGEVPISARGRTLSEHPPFIPESPCPVRRPSWSVSSPRPAPAPGQDTPHTWEHADEVQVPFLQKTLDRFDLVPVLFGEVDARAVADVLARELTSDTLLVISSDLSHYHPYSEARKLDDACVRAICDLDVNRLETQEACGKGPILTLLHLARAKGWKARLLDYRNSGDTAGDKSQVVGYAAIAFYDPAAAPAAAAPVPPLSEPDKQFLLELGRKSLVASVTRAPMPEVPADAGSERLRQVCGCFVTLTKNHRLRGCIGHIVPQRPLYQAVLDNARNAALRDPRFDPVQPDELSEIQLEVSVLTTPQPLAYTSPEDLLAKLRPGTDGVVLHLEEGTATFLPQVWEQLPDKVQFLNQLSVKAGGEPGAWRHPAVRVSLYQVEAFSEPPAFP